MANKTISFWVSSTHLYRCTLLDLNWFSVLFRGSSLQICVNLNSAYNDHAFLDVQSKSSLIQYTLYLILILMESLILVTISRHVSINFFKTENLTVVKFAIGYAKMMNYVLIPTASLTNSLKKSIRAHRVYQPNLK